MMEDLIMQSVLTVVLIVLLYLVILGIGIANYVMTSLSLYTIASRRNINNPWLAWIPYANYWIIGSIADEYDARNGIKRKWRVVLLTLVLTYFISFIIVYGIMMILIIATSNMYETGMTAAVSGIVITYIIFILVILVGVAFSMLSSICIYKIFESTVPEKSVKYMILYMLVPLAAGICLLKSRNQGYPYAENINAEIPENTVSDITNQQEQI